MTNKHVTPHDTCFRSAMSNPKVAQEFFEQHLPANIKAVVDFATITLKQESLIDDKLKLQITDLLFSAEFNHRPGYLYLLVEHQSTPVKLMAFRMLKYIVAIMERHLNTTKQERLPIVYPIIFYMGRNHYHYSTDLFDLFGEDKELAQEILWKPYQLVDLTQLSDDHFHSFLWYGVLARTMKHIFEKDFLPTLKELVKDLKNLEDRGELSYIYTILSYIVNAGEVSRKEEFEEIIKTGLSEVDEEKVMTLAELYKQEGWQKGRQEGRQEGRIEAEKVIALKLLKNGMDIGQIAQLTELSNNEIEKLKQQIQ